MRRPPAVLSSVPGLVLVALLAGCGGGDSGPGGDGAEAAADPPPAAAEPSGQGVAAPAGAQDTDPTGDSGAEPSDSDPEDVSASVDLSVPPEPDPTASAADHADFGWAFERGRTEGLYGRADYYEPHGVSEPGSMAGLQAREAYRAGFSLGLAQSEGPGQSGAAAQESASSAEPDGPVGEVLEGWDARSAVSTYWELDEPLSCDEAGPDEPCLDTWYTFGNRTVVAVARLDPTAGPEPRTALELRGHVRGYEVLQAWDLDADNGDETTLPDWARDG